MMKCDFYTHGIKPSIWHSVVSWGELTKPRRNVAAQ